MQWKVWTFSLSFTKNYAESVLKKNLISGASLLGLYGSSSFGRFDVAYTAVALAFSVAVLGRCCWHTLSFMEFKTRPCRFRCLSNETLSQASCRLAKHFFETSSRWSLPLCVSLSSDKSNVVHSSRPVSITTSPKAGDFGRSTTRPTAMTILAEMKRATSLLASADTTSLSSQLASVMESLDLSSFLSMFQMVVSIKVNAPDDYSIDFVVADTKAWACRQLLHVTIELERVLDASQIRPRPTPVRIAKGTFVWFVGIQASASPDFTDFVNTKQLTVRQDWINTFPLGSANEKLPTIELKSAYDMQEYLRG